MKKLIIFTGVLAILIQLLLCSCSSSDEYSLENASGLRRQEELKISGEFIGSFERGGSLGNMDVYIYDNYIYVFDEEQLPIQSIQLFSEMDVFSITENFKTEDINFDGYTDIGVMNVLGTSNAYYDYYLWNNESGVFSYYQPLSDVSSPIVRSESQTIYSYISESAFSFSEYTYRWVNGELVMRTSEQTVYDDKGNGTVTTKTYDESGKEISSKVEQID